MYVCFMMSHLYLQLHLWALIEIRHPAGSKWKSLWTKASPSPSAKQVWLGNWPFWAGLLNLGNYWEGEAQLKFLKINDFQIIGDICSSWLIKEVAWVFKICFYDICETSCCLIKISCSFYAFGVWFAFYTPYKFLVPFFFFFPFKSTCKMCFHWE